MLREPELFNMVENTLIENGIIREFEEKNGPVRGRMMITLADIPEELDIQPSENEDVFAFECSFDFYDTSIGLALNVISRDIHGGIWITPQIEGAEAPDRTWIEFFVKTLLGHIESDGAFGVPMYTFLADVGDITIIPTGDE